MIRYPNNRPGIMSEILARRHGGRIRTKLKR
jgi:hypothetical protein